MEKSGYIPNVTAHIKEDLAAGRCVVGTMFIEKRGVDALPDPFTQAKELGYRFVIVDCEHQLYNPETLSDYAERAHRVGISTWIHFKRWGMALVPICWMASAAAVSKFPDV